jgi:hypothetical protein
VIDYSYVGGNPLSRIDPLGLCKPGPGMKKCLEEIFGVNIDDIDVIIDPPMIERHFGPGVEGATTLSAKVIVEQSLFS